MTTQTTSIYLKIDAIVGSDVVAEVIPAMIHVANIIGCAVQSSLNGVTVVADPGADAFDLAVAWRMALKSKSTHPFAFARQGKELMEQSR